MLHYLKYKEIDKEKWDACIDNSLNALPYAYSWYLDIVTNKSWDAIILDEYQAVFPVPVKNFIAYKKVYQPFFTQQFGLFVKNEMYYSVLPDCLNILKRKYKKIYLHLNTSNVLENSDVRLTHHLDLTEAYDLIYARYGSAVKNNLKTFGKNVSKPSDEISIEECISYVENHVGDKAQELKQKDFEILSNLISIALQKKKGFLKCIRNENDEILSLLFMLNSNKYLIYLLGASSSEGRKKQAMTLLLDSIIKEYANTDTTLDFEGSMIPGIAQFYKRFGGKEVYFPVVSTNK